jgi:hypothetical protein
MSALEINTGITDYDWNVRGLEWFKNDSDTYNFVRLFASQPHWISLTFLDH